MGQYQRDLVSGATPPLVGVRLGQDDAELATAQAPDDVRGAHVAQQHLGDVLERRVAGGEAVDEALNAADHAMYASKRDANDATR